MKIENYERKTFVVQAVRVTLENMPDVIAWCGGNLKQDELHRPYIKVEVRRPANVKQTMAYEGDWVLKTGTGVRIYTDHAFHKSFDPTEKPVDPYQQQNTFDLPGIDRKVVVEKPVGDEKLIQGESVETVVEPAKNGGFRTQARIDTVRRLEASERTPFVRTPQQIRDAHRTVGPIWSDGTPVLPEDLMGPVASDGKYQTYLENYAAEHGHYPAENIDQDHA
jgi:hypothetical protein